MQDLQDLLVAMNAAESGLATIPPRIIDLTATTSGVTAMVDLLTIVEERRRRVFPNAFKVALVAPRAIDVGNARMFQILLDNPQIRSEIFPTVAEAERWALTP